MIFEYETISKLPETSPVRSSDLLGAFKAIKNHFGKNKSAGPTILYLSMAEYVTDTQSGGNFTATLKELSELSNISARSVTSYLKGLQECGVVKVQSGREEGYVTLANTYTLLTAPNPSNQRPAAKDVSNDSGKKQ